MYKLVDDQNCACNHGSIKTFTYISALVCILSLVNKYIVDSITMYTDQTVDRSFDDDLKIDSLFGGD